MIVYHGSLDIITQPDVLHSFRPLDFGRGFYVTTVLEQAQRWARRKADLFGKETAVVNKYDMSENYRGLSVKTFNDDLMEWIDFVCACRDGSMAYKEYDLIIGKVADDKVFRVVDMYHMGIWDKKRALKEIRVYQTYDQLAFISQKAIDRLLVFQSAKEV